MCGFVGVLNGDREKPSDVRITEGLSDCLRHRGPDDAGSYADGPYAVSHRRLKIIDLTVKGRQPMQNAAGTISIAYNGEVYNFLELKEKYALAQRFSFRSRTDTEVLLYLYELLGIDFVDELNGMFAVAIWDSLRKSLYLIRDRFGIKPLFYTVIDDSVWFASEIKALLSVPGFNKKPSLEALHHYFSFDYIPGELTAFEGIKEVRPGCWLEFRCGDRLSRTDRQYWKPRYGSEVPQNIGKAVEDIRGLLESSVRSQLISDVPIGVMLSGGLDSSTLTALMSRLRGDSQFHTFSIGFVEKSFDESSSARVVADKIGTIHHHVAVKPRLVADNLEKQSYFIDEPYADGSAIPTYLLSQEAKNYVTVLLSGEGGDEVFAGYETYLAYKIRKIYRRTPGFARTLLRQLSRLLPVSHEKLSLDFKFKRFVRGAEHSVPVSHFKWREVFSPEDKEKLFENGAELRERFGDSNRFFTQHYAQNSGGDELNTLLNIDCTYHLPDDLMIKNDRMTMAHSLEARVPFTDLHLFEYLARLRGSAKVHRLTLKYLLKKAMKPYLPEEILHKKKIGLELPYSEWFCHELRELLLDYLSPSTLRAIPFLRPMFVQEVIVEHLEKRRDRGRELWGLLNFVVWYRQHWPR
ncbi:MAG: asparagine synthase (glutamine-hydrolyzing) [Clostridiales bacterium]|nr:asparagine synthase (glutamine-hydrolyzing) [Clostridiales bacterium]